MAIPQYFDIAKKLSHVVFASFTAFVVVVVWSSCAMAVGVLKIIKVKQSVDLTLPDLRDSINQLKLCPKLVYK